MNQSRRQPNSYISGLKGDYALHPVLLLCLVLVFGRPIGQTQTQSTPNSPTGTANPSNEASAERVYSRKDGKIKPPRPTYSPNPGYAREAGEAFPNAKVVLWLIVGGNGLPRDVKVARSVAPQIDQTAIDTVSKWRFRPATLDGKPVAVQINVEFIVRKF
jgi:TonB family protein